MAIEKLPIVDLPVINALIKDYYGGKLNTELYNFQPKLASFEQAIAQRESTFPINREVLVEVLEEQYKDVPNAQRSLEQIAALRSNNTFTVTTGHQLCLYTGPLYFIYKIASVISLAKKLSKAHPEKNFVPVYWMATEDHDFEEINHAHVFHDTLSWLTDQTGMVGDMLLDGISEVNESLFDVFGDSPASDELKEKIQSAFAKGHTLAKAMRLFVHDLFSEYGVVIIDANDTKLKRCFIPQIKRELLEGVAEKNIQSTVPKLAEYNVQSHPRELNLFYVKPGIRERIVRNESGFEVLNTSRTFTEEEMIKEVEQFPERFSPNVNLRPVYQELILPNLAYIGGGGELSYWLELKSTFDALNAFYPILLLRDSFVHINKGTQKKMQKFSLSLRDLFSDREPIIQDRVKRESSVSLDLSEEKKAIAQLFQGLIPKVSALDKSLEASTKSEMSKVMKSLENLEHKMLRAEKKNHDQTVSQINGVFDKVFPNGTFQERRENMTMYYLFQGQGFIDSIVESADPLECALKVMLPD